MTKLKGSLSTIILASLLLLFSACCRTEKIDNVKVGELVESIEEIEYVQEVEVYHMGFDLTIDVYIEEESEKEECSRKIFDLAEKCLDEEVVSELKEEFEQKIPPDTEIYIRNTEGKILIDFSGSCYESYNRDVPPDYTEYAWRRNEWEI